MSKPEVKPAIPNVRRCLQIVRLLLWSHRIPYPVTLLVAPDVVELRGGVKYDQVDTSNGNENPIAATVAR